MARGVVGSEDRGGKGSNEGAGSRHASASATAADPTPGTSKPASKFCSNYPLADARSTKSTRSPLPHQQKALNALRRWYDAPPAPEAGGLLVLPTGGGKTFTATRFLASGPLSDGYKVLWLAHTHHLLEQAHESLRYSVSEIHAPKATLQARVVSGAPGHFPPSAITKNDDFVASTLQTLRGALDRDLPSLSSFLDACNGKLVVIFDEAHHAPAPSYRKLVMALRARCERTLVLGLTATPTYTDEAKRPWLAKVFPQGILHQTTARALMADQVLATPEFIRQPTEFVPTFDDQLFEEWHTLGRDIPDRIVSDLAANRERNALIADVYAAHRTKFGKTIIFADRIHQCVAIKAALEKRGVSRVDAVYSHVEPSLATADERNQRTKTDNDVAIQRFKSGELDVLINIRMLTEGTDVPDVQSVFVTRQTTSQILFTQMVGRALRGKKLNGTDKAYIVTFVDDWRHLIHWAEYGELTDGVADDDAGQRLRHAPISLISIDLIRRLARQMDTGANIAPLPFLSFLPVGWYRVKYVTAVADSDEDVTVDQPLMVFEGVAPAFAAYIEYLVTKDLTAFEQEDFPRAAALVRVDADRARFFGESTEHVGNDLRDDMLSILRHVAQSGEAPKFFTLEDRDKHDIDVLAKEAIDRDWGARAEDDAVRLEYGRTDRLWSMFFPRYEQFKGMFSSCRERQLSALRTGDDPETHQPRVEHPEALPDREPPEGVKRQVLARDGRCLACGAEHGLQVDHVVPSYFGGGNLLDNLQSLCKVCNRLKGTRRINFRDPQADSRTPPQVFSTFADTAPSGKAAGDRDHWARYIRRCVNFFYGCAAVHDVHIGGRGERFYAWQVEFSAGNDPEWLRPHLPALLAIVTERRQAASLGVPERIEVMDDPAA